jgi:DNA-directed RNA polymerase specialized sigma24 family protein
MTTMWPGTSRSLEWSQFRSRRDDPKAMEQSSEPNGPTLGRDALAYADSLYNLARHLAGNAADAEDLVQDTYRRAIQAANQFTPRSDLKA